MKNKIVKTKTAVVVLKWRPVISVLSTVRLSPDLPARIQAISEERGPSSILKITLPSPIRMQVILKPDIPSVAADRLCAKIAKEVEASNQGPGGQSTPDREQEGFTHD